MSSEKLQQEVDKLHLVIKDVGAADDCTTAELQQIADEINLSLSEPESEPAIDALTHRLEAEAYKFAESHPALAEGARQVIEVLKNIGV